MILQGWVSGYDGEVLTITAPCPDASTLLRQNISSCEVRLDDGRTISADQRKKIYATLRDISLWSGHTPDEVKALCKYDYIARTGNSYFSLSDTDMTTAREFLEFLIEFCLLHDIPTQDSLLERSPDTARYVYACLLHKKCCITGRKAELHHADAIGMGRDRREVIHQGMRVLPLCRRMHTEAHAIGEKTFCEKYHLCPIRLDDDLCQVWNVKG